MDDLEQIRQALRESAKGVGGWKLPQSTSKTCRWEVEKHRLLGLSVRTLPLSMDATCKCNASLSPLAVVPACVHGRGQCASLPACLRFGSAPTQRPFLKCILKSEFGRVYCFEVSKHLNCRWTSVVDEIAFSLTQRNVRVSTSQRVVLK